MFNTVKPEFILECGSMYGGSVIVMAEEIKKAKSPAQIVCVDPFTGSAEMLCKEYGEGEHGWNHKMLKFENGLPTIYKRFLANVDAAGHANRILPLNCTTITGVRTLTHLHKHKRISQLPSVIYLDAAHEYDETLLELRACWNMMPSRGVLFGDDWKWDDVRVAIEGFAREVDLDEARANRFCQILEGANVTAVPFWGSLSGIVIHGDCSQWLLFKP